MVKQPKPPKPPPKPPVTLLPYRVEWTNPGD